LKTIGVGGDNSVKRPLENPTVKGVEGTGSVSILEAVRMLAAMTREERIALVALIKVVGGGQELDHFGGQN